MRRSSATKLAGEFDSPAATPEASDPDRPTEIDESPFSVVVATKGRPELVGHSLSSLRRLDYPTFEVLLVDGSLDSSTKEAFDDLVGDDERFRYIAEPRPGLSLARNVGVSEARFDLVAFTDDDCRADPRWFRPAWRGDSRWGSEIACITGMVPSSDLTDACPAVLRQPGLVVQLPDITGRRPDRLPGDSPLYPFRMGVYGTGANFALRRDAVMEIGWFSVLVGRRQPVPAEGARTATCSSGSSGPGAALADEPSAIVWHQGRAEDAALKAQLRRIRGRHFPSAASSGSSIRRCEVTSSGACREPLATTSIFCEGAERSGKWTVNGLGRGAGHPPRRGGIRVGLSNLASPGLGFRRPAPAEGSMTTDAPAAPTERTTWRIARWTAIADHGESGSPS